MEMIMIIFTLLCLMLSALLPSCTSLQVQFQPSQDDDHQVNKVEFSVPTLPRKLRFIEEVKTSKGIDLTSNKKQKEDLSGKKYPKKQSMMHGISKGTWPEWVEKDETTSQFFTMDYSHVKRRRPIHNKSMPVAP
ncbi:hypothetical protein O6P43_032869 [Quillaja saponaria]|uniref:Root meristem growth factor 8 n=1 Tax=Quillaja saponaria TaxID=32244 RepID=A0AAD7KNS9_QUISA|nr:hypothetical protein O6P43_032869 [Quillaja saponaria]